MNQDSNKQKILTVATVKNRISYSQKSNRNAIIKSVFHHFCEVLQGHHTFLSLEGGLGTVLADLVSKTRYNVTKQGETLFNDFVFKAIVRFQVVQ